MKSVVQTFIDETSELLLEAERGTITWQMAENKLVDSFPVALAACGDCEADVKSVTRVYATALRELTGGKSWEL